MEDVTLDEFIKELIGIRDRLDAGDVEVFMPSMSVDDEGNKPIAPPVIEVAMTPALTAVDVDGEMVEGMASLIMLTPADMIEVEPEDDDPSEDWKKA